jgi:hypothetical protein
LVIGAEKLLADKAANMLAEKAAVLGNLAPVVNSSSAFSNLFNSSFFSNFINYNGGGSLVAKLSAVDCAFSTLSRTRASWVRFPVTASMIASTYRFRFSVASLNEARTEEKRGEI